MLGISKQQQLKHNKKKRRKKCRQCEELFEPERDMQPCCSYNCEIKYIDGNLNSLVDEGKKNREKESNKKKREFLDNDKSHQLKECQKVVNQYVRLRDLNKVCVSCGIHYGKFDAGHYFNQGGHSSIRFNTFNIHKQCSQCNRILSGNLVKYKPELIRRIGKFNFKKLDFIKNDYCKYDLEYLHRLKKVFRKKIKIYEKKFRIN